MLGTQKMGFNPWVWEDLYSRKWQPTPVFLPGKFVGQRSLVGYSLWGRTVWCHWATERVHKHAEIWRWKRAALWAKHTGLWNFPCGCRDFSPNTIIKDLTFNCEKLIFFNEFLKRSWPTTLTLVPGAQSSGSLSLYITKGSPRHI